MNQNSSVRKLARCAVVAAIYVVLCMALQPFSYGAVQVRVAEALCLLPVFGPEYIAGVVLGGTAIVGGSGTLYGCMLGTALIVMVENSMILIGSPTVWKDFFVGALIVVGTGISAMQVTRANKAGLRNLKKEAVK